jgi:hypothetical protein
MTHKLIHACMNAGLHSVRVRFSHVFSNLINDWFQEVGAEMDDHNMQRKQGREVRRPYVKL